MNFVIASLFFTNLWIFFYTNTLFLLNLYHKQIVTEAFLFPLAVPEPYEIPLYLFLTFVFTLIIFLIFRFFTIKNQINKYLKLIILILLLFLFLINLGKYPMTGDYSPYPPLPFKMGYLLVLIFYLITVATITLESAILGKIIKNKFSFLLISLIVILSLILLTFEPKFPISGHDYSFFFGPVWEVSHGKTIYTETPSQYGFLLILFLAVLYKVKILSLSYLPVFFWLLYLIQFYLVFYLIFKVSKSYILALISMFSLLTLNFFSIAYIPIELPQGGPMRWLPLIFALFFFLKFKRIDSKLFIFLLAFSSFWVIDGGLYLILSYFLTLFFLFLTKQVSFFKAFISSLWFAISIVLILLIVNLIHVFLGLQPVDLISGFTKVNQYAKQGYAMLPMETRSYFWFVLLTYFFSLIYFFRINSKSTWQAILLLFSANFSFFAGIYYVGRSHPHNLFAVAVMTLINFFILISLIFQSIKPTKYKPFLYFLLFSLFIIFPAYQRKDAISNIFENRVKRYQQANYFSTVMDEYFAQNYIKEIKLIKENFKEKKIALIQSDESFLLYYTDKENLISTNPQTSIISEKDLDLAVKEIAEICPKKIAVDCRLVDKCDKNNYHLFADPRLFVQPLLLAKIEKNCQIKYKPSHCTSKLCMASTESNL